MTLNAKLIISLSLIVAVFSSFIYLQSVKITVEENYKSYVKTSNEINIITKLKNYYGDKKVNKRKTYNIINQYNAKISNKKEDKSSIEFTISKLNYKELDSINKSLLNSGIKIVKLKIIKIDLHTAELFCKVMF